MSPARAAALLILAAAALPLAAQQTLRFDCGRIRNDAAIHLTSTSLYTPATPGFDLQPPPTVADGACTSDKPFFFSIALPDGDYRVAVTLGGKQASDTTLRAESRRLLLKDLPLAAGRTSTQEFTVNVRTPTISTTNEQVRLKPREVGALDWDNKLTLEFNGAHPAFRSLTVTPVSNVPTWYLAGDSTVVDQDKEPWAAWGQMLPAFFGPGLAIANNAESGETIRSFVGERRLEKVMSTLKPGDYLAIQFAHNDQKPGNGFVSIPDYKAQLKSYIDQARARGATPILVTAMNRRSFDETGHIRQTLGDYPQATRDIAAEQHVALIDLNAMSKTLFEALGEAGTLKAFVHYPANTFPGQVAELKDDTHFNSYGAYELARAVVQSIRDQHLPLAQYLRKDIPPFNPAQPDSVAEWHLPQSPAIDTTTPYGR